MWSSFLSAGIAALPSAILMVAGYFFASWIMKGSAAVAVTSLPGNAIQGGVGIALAVLLLLATSRIKSFSELVGKNQFYEELAKPNEESEKKERE